MKLIRVSDFSEKYGVSHANIYNSRLRKSILRDGYIREDYLIRLNKHQSDVINFNQNIYYWLNGFFNDYQLAELMDYLGIMKKEGAYDFLVDKMFRAEYDKSILDCLIRKNHSKFNFFARNFKRWVDNKVRCKVDVDKILDKRMVNE